MVISKDGGEDSYKDAIDIYKMEYERCAQRYNDLYNAAWTNFSYMALISGGVLTFGGSRFVELFCDCIFSVPPTSFLVVSNVRTAEPLWR
jgi:hypothetical protein